jgi:hypothetical protein
MAKCTPEYNDETRRLKAHVADLRRVAKGAESGDFGEAIRAKANETIDSGVTDPTKVVEAAHEFINKYAPHEKSEVAAKIAEKQKAATQSEASKQRAAVRAEIRDLEKVQKGLDADAAERAKQSEKQSNAALDRQIADLERQIETNVNTEQKRGKPDTPEIAAKRAKLAELREQKKMQTNPPPATKPAEPTKAQQRQINPERVREQEQRDRLQAEIDKIDEAIGAGGTHEKGKIHGPYSAEIAGLKAERAAKKRELENLRPSPEATRPVDPQVAKNKAALARLKNREAELTHQLETNDFTGPPKKTYTLKPNEEVQAAQQRVKEAENKIELAMRKGERINASPYKKALDLATALTRFMIFTSLHVFKKLGYAVGGGHTHAFLSDAMVSLAKTVPAIRRLAEKAPDYGAGLTVAGQKARYGALATQIGKTAKGIATLTAEGGPLETLKHGASKLELAGGHAANASDAYYAYIGTLSDALATPGKINKALEITHYGLSMPARLHGFEKQFLSNPAFWQSKTNQAIQITRAMEKAGHTPEEIDAFIKHPTTEAVTDARALARNYEEKMQGKNRWNDAILSWVSQLDRSKNPVAQTIAAVFHQALPVARIGANVVKQGSSIFPGGGLIKAGIERLQGGEMTPERADYIMKNIGAQGTGFVLMGLGMVYSELFGGVPGAEAKKKVAPGETTPLQPGKADLGGMPVGGEAFHGGPFAMTQIGAGIVHVYEQEMKLNHEDAVNAALYSVGTNLANWAERTLPITDQMRRIDNTLTYGRNHGKAGNPWMEVLGNQLRTMFIPTGLQQVAEEEDPDKRFLRPTNLKQDIIGGIPGKNYRESVPHGGPVRQP